MMNLMDPIWNWLMRTNAKALFVLTLLTFIGITAWRIWVEIEAMRPPDESPADRQPAAVEDLDLPAYREVGLLALLSNQLARADASIPVNPFRPEFDDLLAEWAESIDPETGLPVTATEAEREAERVRQAEAEAEAEAEADAEANAAARERRRREERERQAQEPPPPSLTYRGLFRRTDERTAAWIHDSSTQLVQFHELGSMLHDHTVMEADLQQLTLERPDGTRVQIALGETLALNPPPPAGEDE